MQCYLALRSAEAQQSLLERTADANQRTLALTQARHASGVVAQCDVLPAQTQVKETVVQRAQLEHAIAVLQGLPPSALTQARSATLPAFRTSPNCCLAPCLSAGPRSPRPSPG